MDVLKYFYLNVHHMSVQFKRKFKDLWQVFMKIATIKFHENPFSWGRTDSLQAESHMDRRS
jgi:hypothetical protein